MSVVTYTTFDGELVEENRDGTILDYVPDSLGSIIMWVDETGLPVSYTPYWPYGEPWQEPEVECPFQFVGKYGYFRDQSGTYVRARVYEPEMGRWMTLDPIWPEEPAFEYASSSPMVNIDASGLRPCSKAEADRCFARLGRTCGARDLRICTVITIKYVKCHIEQSRDELFCECLAKRRWTCRANCPVIGPTPPCGFINRGVGSGATREEACNAAKKDALAQPKPEECHREHCRCYDCTRN